MHDTNVRQLLLELGTPPGLVGISIPFTWFTPLVSDPDAPSVIEIIRTVQRGLRRLGYAVQVSGVLDRSSAAALAQVAGRSWQNKQWVQLLADLARGARDPERTAHRQRYQSKGLDGYFIYEGAAPGPLPSWRAGTPPGPLGMLGLGATATDAGVALEFGQGVSNPKNIVPIPKNSGVTYNAFRNLQRQINRLLSHKRIGPIAEDGIIGPGTFSAFEKIHDLLGISVPGDDSTLGLAEHSVTIGTMLSAQANSLGISTSANRGSTTSASSQKEPTPPPMTTMQRASFGGGALGAVTKYGPFLLLAGGVAYLATKLRSKKRKK
jgi:hypothetical protein